MFRGMQWFGWRAVLAMSTALVLAGCTQAAPPLVVRNSSVPLVAASEASNEAFTSKAEAKSTLSMFYIKYTRVVDDVLNAGGREPERLSPYLSPPLLADELKTMTTLRASMRHTAGRAQMAHLLLQTVDLASGTATAYVCVDQSKVRVMSASGTDVTPASRPARQTLKVAFVRSHGTLRIDRSEVWAGSSVC